MAHENHEKLYAGTVPYRCSACLKTFTTKQNLVSHEMLHRGEKPYACPVCGKRFTWKAYLVDHERTHTGERRHVCGVCLKGFAKKVSLVKHERLHTVERPYVCQRGCAHKWNLGKHGHANGKPCACTMSEKVCPQMAPVGEEPCVPNVGE